MFYYKITQRHAKTSCFVYNSVILRLCIQFNFDRTACKKRLHSHMDQGQFHIFKACPLTASIHSPCVIIRNHKCQGSDILVIKIILVIVIVSFLIIILVII